MDASDPTDAASETPVGNEPADGEPAGSDTVSSEPALPAFVDWDAYDAVVYDLDGTLVDLQVDWNQVATDVIGVYEDAAIDPPGDGLWELLESASEHGLEADVEAAIASHERAGAEASDRLALADALQPTHADRTAVCSLNCEAACRIALSTHGVADGVSAVVGRDSVATHKPDPEPLLAAVRALDAEPERALFVGDSERDAVTAERAGVAFQWVDGDPDA
ncbi:MULTISPECIES: HAD family hydrolase [unclassified Haloparvum]|uniref:HAD family hydrolase n=1 Tax=Haloparvum sp. PAK95 TaxID=3418962 RepID=UPI003D2EC856